MEDSLSLIEPSAFDQELLASLTAVGEKVVLESPEPYFSLIEDRLVISGSMAIGGELLCQRKSTDTDDDWVSTMRKVLTTTEELLNLSPDDDIVIIGDNMINYAYIIKDYAFINRFWLFFSVPQDTYVILGDSSFCLQYTYEDELFLHRVKQAPMK